MASPPTSENFNPSATFPGNDRETWEALLAASSGRETDADSIAKVLEKLSTTTLDGINIKPLYSVEDHTPASYATDAPRRYGREPGEARPWDIRQAIRCKDTDKANQAILEELQRGATSVQLALVASANANTGANSSATATTTEHSGISLPSAQALEKLLEGVYLDLITLAIEPAEIPGEHSAWLLEFYANQKIDAEATRLALNIDPLLLHPLHSQSTSTHEQLASNTETLVALAHTCVSRYESVTSTAIDTRHWHNLGATNVQELGIACAAFAHWMKEFLSAGLSLEQAANQVVFHFSLDTDFFTNIAKLRAVRELRAYILQQFSTVQSTDGDDGFRIIDTPAQVHAYTSQRMLARLDADNNQLRNTLACSAAALGGADIISVEPHRGSNQSGFPIHEPDEVSSRIARNLQLVLLEESNLHRVNDPMGGSAFIESLTSDMVTLAWQEFQNIEREGGIAESQRSGAVLKRVNDTHQQRQQTLATGRAPLVGVSQFATLDEPELKTLETSGPADTLRRSSEPFEHLRMASWNTKPGVLLLNLGKPGDYRARNGFCQNFVAAAGIHTQSLFCEDSNDLASLTEKIQAALKKASTTTLILCSSDNVYVELQAEFFDALRGAGATHIGLAGRIASLDTGAAIHDNCDDDIYLGCHAIEKLNAILAAAGVNVDPGVQK